MICLVKISVNELRNLDKVNEIEIAVAGKFSYIKSNSWRAGRTAIAPVLKTGGRKPLGVRIPRSPLFMRFSVYLLYSPLFDRTYIGQTKEIDPRLSLHNAGRVRSTKAYRPWVLVYSEECGTRSEAMVREKWLKSSRGRTFIAKVITEYKNRQRDRSKD